jgi:hypothetical protein
MIPQLSTRFGIGASERPVDEGDEVNFPLMGGDRDGSLATLGFDSQEQVARSVVRVLVDLLAWLVRCHGQRIAGVCRMTTPVYAGSR